jgi:hypothetical protein
MTRASSMQHRRRMASRIPALYSTVLVHLPVLEARVGNGNPSMLNECRPRCCLKVS